MDETMSATAEAPGINFRFFKSSATISTPTGDVTVRPTKALPTRYETHRCKLLECDHRILKSLIERMGALSGSLNKFYDIRSKQSYDPDLWLPLIKSTLTDLRHFELDKEKLYFPRLLEIKSIRLSTAEKEREYLDLLRGYWTSPEDMIAVSERCHGHNLYSHSYLRVLIYGWVAHSDADKAKVIADIRNSRGDQDWLMMASVLCHMHAAIIAEYICFMASYFPKFRNWIRGLSPLVSINISGSGTKSDNKVAAMVGETMFGTMEVATDKKARMYHDRLNRNLQGRLDFGKKS